MLVGLGLLVTLVLLWQTRAALGPRWGSLLAGAALLFAGGAWAALDWHQRSEPPLPEDRTTLAPVTAHTCIKCHEGHHASWHRTYHRSMTREATPENVKGDFNDAVHVYQGVTSRFARLNGRYYVYTLDPTWEARVAQLGVPRDQAGPPLHRAFSVDRLVGSHWFQQLLHRDEAGRYHRLPLAYHIAEQRWIHINGVFLTPDTPTFFSNVATWNETCLYCHNTRPSMNPKLYADRPPGYATAVGELGISCEACHGAAERHVAAHQNPLRRLGQRYADAGDPTIVNPARLPPAQADAICARCHGGTMPRHTEWNKATFADPYLAGRDLRRFWYLPFSEAEVDLRRKGDETGTPPPGPLDGRFWGDGTPLTTALEYQGLALSACYEKGHGKMSCLTCHSMHHADPDHQVKEGMRTNAACYKCHPEYRAQLTQHTHHPADAPGSLCASCHMPHQVYSLLTTHRSHRIDVPRVRESISTGKPHACNLCHLDKSLGWTQEQLGKWYGTKPAPLPEEQRTQPTALLHLAQGDARSRAVVAGAFALPGASGRAWAAPLLLQILERERFEAVRYTLHKSLRAMHGAAAADYNYQGTPAERAAQVAALRRTLNVAGPDPAVERLLRTRKDPDVYINE